jgi:hypothetical protein
MDPSKTLEELKSLLFELDMLASDAPLEIGVLIEGMHAKFEELDEWLQRGGFLPQAWQRSANGGPLGQNGSDASS